jgi:hypothetical protein
MAWSDRGFVSSAPSDGIQRSEARAARARGDTWRARDEAFKDAPDWNEDALEAVSLRAWTRPRGTPPAVVAHALDMPSSEFIADSRARRCSLERRSLASEAMALRDT